MKQKTSRYLVLSPILLSLLTFLKPYVPASSFASQFFMPGPIIFGIALLCIVWYIYFSNYRYGKQILLVQGAISFAGVSWIVLAHYAHLNNAVQRLVAPADTQFLLNLCYMFMAGYLIQILYYWLPRTKLYINLCIAAILFMVMLSIFGHLYDFHGTESRALLLPMPFGVLFSYFILTLIIFAHTNRMKRLYLNSKIILSFAAMFVAVIGANAVVYKNLQRTVQISDQISTTRQVLVETYTVGLYLGRAQTDAQAYEASGDAKYIAAYQSSRQQYTKAMSQLLQRSGEVDVANARAAVQEIAKLGGHIIALADSAVAQKQPSSLSAHTARDAAIDADIDQIVNGIRSISLAYTDQLGQLTSQESFGSRGIVLGVSITSALSLLLLIFTPLFIRQTIQKLGETQRELQDSNKQLSEEKSRAEAILADIGNGLFVIDTDGVITVFNRAAEAISGVRRDAALGQHYENVLHFISYGNSGTAINPITRALQGKTHHLSHNVVLESSEGQAVDVQVTASPVRNKADAVLGAIIVFRDRSSEQELENAKDDFVSLASHQLRTPATATKQFLAMFLQGYAGPINDKQRLFLQQAYDNNELGIAIIEDLLNITRLENNRFKVEKKKIELSEFLQKSVAQHQPFAQKDKQKLHLIAPSKHVYIEADPSLLGMAVDNLITNALKYSDTGDTVTVRLLGGERVSVAISDEGIGIKKEDIQQLFTRFRRLQDPKKQYVSGTGVGLYLVKQIAAKLHATIKVESEYGKGSTFTLLFKPLK